MQLNDILTLARAGYTADQIAAFDNPAPAAAPTPAPAAPQAAPAPVIAPAPAPTLPNTQPAPAPTSAPNDNSAELISALLKLAAQNPAQQIQQTNPALESALPPAPAQIPTPQEQAPAQAVNPAPASTPAQTSPVETSAEQILRSLGAYTQGVAIPKPETLDERMANTLRLALGIHEETKK